MKRANGHFLKTGFSYGIAVMGTVIGNALMSYSAYASDGHGGGGGLPQMDASQYPGLLFWLAICFPALFLLMHFWIVPQIQDAQGTRLGLLDTDLTAARQASEKSQDMMANYERALAEARTKAFATVESIVSQSMTESEASSQKQQIELQNRLDEAHQRIDTARQAALRDVPKAVDDLVEAIVKKLAGKAA